MCSTALWIEKKRQVFDDAITSKLGNSIFKPLKPAPDFVPYSDGDLDPITIDDMIGDDPVDNNGQSVFEKPELIIWFMQRLRYRKGRTYY